ncbi:hypothetical protein KBB08_00165 [Candidatus Gracilibacteria bacterium]|nr:hypothetical protein [Candidatus Gracilibacteria bacterium]
MLTQYVNQALSQYLIAAQVQAINGATADLKIESSGEHVQWPAMHLPAHIQPGMSITIQVGTPEQIVAERNSIAHEVLRELIR